MNATDSPAEVGTWPATVDRTALRAILTEAITAHRAIVAGTLTTDQAEQSALYRCAAYVLGATYHVGYDRSAADAWHGAVKAVQAAVEACPHWGASVLIVGWVHPEALAMVEAALLPVAVASDRARLAGTP